MFGLMGGMHYIIMLMAASTASKFQDDEDDGQCPCIQYSPINPYAFINNHILQSSMPGANRNEAPLEEAETEIEEASTTEEPSSSPLNKLLRRYPDDL